MIDENGDEATENGCTKGVCVIMERLGMGLPCNCVEVALADLLDRMKKAFPSCQVNEIDILQHMPKCECINVVSVTFQQANGVGYDYHLCQEHINLILAIRKHHNEEGL